MSDYKFKIGDRVELYKIDGEDYELYGKYVGEVGEIEYINADSDGYACVNFEDGKILRPYFRNIRLANKIIKKSDLRNGDIVTYRNGSKRIVDKKNEKIVLLRDFDVLCFYFSSFNDDLMRKDESDNEYDIVEVYRPETKETFITERTKKVKEMTLKEVCKELGYEVKIVKEEN